MKLPAPKLPSYDMSEWKKQPFHERWRMVCGAWAEDGYAPPWPSYVFYLLKLALYVGLWVFFCRFSAEAHGAASARAWLGSSTAFQKAVLWSMLYEVLGLGCGSGPLTGRYWPPVGGALYWLRPGTTKLPLIPRLPLLGGSARTLLDVGLYALLLGLCVRGLVAPALEATHLVPVLACLGLLGLADKTLFLAARAEHYAVVLACLLFRDEWLPACKVVWLGVWWWAATSKVNRHFPSVVSVMQTNSPVLGLLGLRPLLFRDAPRDLRPSRVAHAMAHAGTLLEYGFPVLLLLGDGGALTVAGLVVMVLFHGFITSSVPMGVPLEWNVLVVGGAFFLFGAHASDSLRALHSPALLALLAVCCVGVQLAGNLWPARVSFLCSMRYYAGNWPYSVWLFRGDCSARLEEKLRTSARLPKQQLARLYDEDTILAGLSKVLAFRSMHLQGRALQLLLPRLVSDLEQYEYFDGELIAGFALGWNFGDGHLHERQLLETVQARCGFAPGELRCLFVESQPLGGATVAYTLADAAEGVLEEGTIAVNSLLELQPWPEPAPLEKARAGLTVR